MGKSKKEATPQMKKTVELVAQGKSVGAAMREAGYSDTYANNPQALTKSQSWENLMEKHFPDDKIATVINEGLEATKTIPIGDGQTVVESDHAIRHKFADMAIKVKGSYAPEKKLNMNLTINDLLEDE